MADPMPYDSLHEVLEPSDRSCAITGCSMTPAAAYTAVRELPGGFVTYESMWGCDEHADELEELDRQDQQAYGQPTPVFAQTQRLSQTCLECDRAATHVAMVARTSSPARRFEALSLCERHVEQLVSDLGPPDWDL